MIVGCRDVEREREGGGKVCVCVCELHMYRKRENDMMCVLELVTRKCVPDQFLHFPCHSLLSPTNYNPMQIWLYLQRRGGGDVCVTTAAARD